MIIAFNDDTTVSVWSDLTDVLQEYEGIDVENGMFEFYSEDGVWLEPVFHGPSRQDKLGFAILRSIGSGLFRLEPRPERLDRPLWRAFLDHPNPGKLEHFQSVSDLRTYLAERGVLVDPPPELAPKDSSGPA